MTTLTDAATATRPQPPEARWRLIRRRPPVLPRVWFELILLASCYLAYSLTRNAVPEQAALAQANTKALWALEKTLGIAVEQSINHAINSVTWLIVSMNYYYATLHFVVTLAVLIWLYRSHPERFAVFRTILMLATGIALVVFFLYPLAPPRLMTDGNFIDTVILHQTWGSFASPSVASASNQYAAMPSMHFGWSAWCGIAVALLARRLWVRILGILYPVVTLLVIVATGNHFWLDAVGGAMAIAAGAVGAILLYYRPVLRGRGISRRRLAP